jgi:hypothetical protein
MTLSSLINALWIVGIVFQGGLAIVLLAKQAWKRYPFFAAYAFFTFSMTVALYLLERYPKVFYYSYWIQEAIAIVLGFGVVYEIFQQMFSAHKALLKLARLTFRWTIVGLFCLAMLVVLLQSPVGSDLTKAILVSEEAMRIVEVGLLVFLFVGSAAFGLHWKQSEFGIALGLGLYVAVHLTTVALRSQVGLPGWQVLNIVSILAFDMSLLVWIGYLLSPDRVTNSSEVPQRAQLEQWNQAVMELINQ